MLVTATKHGKKGWKACAGEMAIEQRQLAALRRSRFGRPTYFPSARVPKLDDFRAAEEIGLNPLYRELSSEIGPTITYAGAEVIMLGSNNYLGLDDRPEGEKGRHGRGGQVRHRGHRQPAVQRHPAPPHRARRAIGGLGRDGAGAGVHHRVTPPTSGSSRPWYGEGDAVFCDSAAHASLVDGARLADGVLRAFFHNRPNSLKRGLNSWRSQPGSGGVLVAVDGIYSMEGDWAPLPEIKALCDDFGARLLVDEAHALGVVGPEGAGTAAATGVRPDLIMGTFSKSLASCGGFIAGPPEVIGFLRLFCRPLLFTASNVPASLGAALAAAKIARRGRLASRSRPQPG